MTWSRAFHPAVLLGALLYISMSNGWAQSSDFTYQGQLQDGGSPATGAYDLQCRLFDALVGGNQVGSTQVLEDVPVAEGIFTITLDFGAEAFPGEGRFLEIAGRPGARGGAFTTLTPLQQITTTPYALHSLNATMAQTAELANSVSDGSVGENQVDSSAVQLRILGQCAGDSSIRVVNEDGTVECHLDANSGDITSVIAGSGLSGGGTTGAVTLNVAAPISVSGVGNSPLILAQNNEPTLYGRAIEGQANGPNGYGVIGSAAVGSGVLGKTSSDSGFGVEGSAFGSAAGSGVYGRYYGAGSGYGVTGSAGTATAIGVMAFNTATTGQAHAVKGQSESTSARSIAGFAFADSGTATGIYGTTTSPSGYGAHGRASDTLNAGLGNGTGVFGESAGGSGVAGASSSGPGVSGSSATGWGVSGGSLTLYGVFGLGPTGVRGETQSTTGFGVAGVNNGGGASVSWGVYGQNTSTGGYGVEGYNPNGVGVRGNGGVYAGQFIGNVQVLGTLSKSAGSFQIDHPLDPENKYLFHSFVESPEMKNIYEGIVELDANGEAWVELPGYFEALNRDFRYQLTALGAGAPYLHVADPVTGNRFRIAGGAPQQEISWQVTGVRKDAYAETHPIEVEVDKPEAERGKYLHPELFGESDEKSIAAVSKPVFPSQVAQAPVPESGVELMEERDNQ